MTLTTDELTELITAVTIGDISIDDANQRAGILETEPGKYHCDTCRFFKVDECHEPGQPARPENPNSARCGRYEFDDPRDSAMPLEPPRGNSRMWK